MHSSAVPAEQQEPRDLVPMNYFTHTYWEIGDRALLPEGFRAHVGDSGAMSDGGSETGIVDALKGDPISSVTLSEATAESGAPGPSGSGEAPADSSGGVPRQRRLSKQQLRRTTKRERKASRKDKNSESAALVVNTRTIVDVLWQDGTKSSKVSACSLIPVDHLGDHDFWPEQYVLEQGSDGDDLINEVRRVGQLSKLYSRCVCVCVFYFCFIFNL